MLRYFDWVSIGPEPFETEQTFENDWQVISSHYLPATLITSHYLPAACSFVQFVRHREGLLNWKDHFSLAKECQLWQPRAYPCYIMFSWRSLCNDHP